MKWFYVYALFNVSLQRFYIGVTADLKRRLKQHSWAKKSYRNKSYKIIFFEAYLNKKDALRRERYLKSTKGKYALKTMLQETLKTLK